MNQLKDSTMKYVLTNEEYDTLIAEKLKRAETAEATLKKHSEEKLIKWYNRCKYVKQATIV